MSDMLSAALQWAEMGIPVFPVIDKIPMIKGGFLSASTDPKTITGWWTRWPKANIGGRMGPESGLWALDIDGAVGGESLERLEQEYGRLPVTAKHFTGRGVHYVFTMPSGVTFNRKIAAFPGIDACADHGYIVLPPSMHELGVAYRIDGDEKPVSAPDWLVELITTKGEPASKKDPAPRAERSRRREPDSAARGGARSRVMGMVAAAVERITTREEGDRNNEVVKSCYSIGGFLEAAGMTADDVAEQLEAACEIAEQPIAAVRRSLEAGAACPRELPEDRPFGRAAAEEPPPGEPLADDTPDHLVWGTLDRVTNEKTCAERCLATLPNAIKILNSDRRWRGRIEHCEFTDRLLLDGRSLQDHDEIEAVCWVARAYSVTFTTAQIHEAFVGVGHRNGFHPVQEYLESLKWDRKERLKTWLVDYAGCEPTADGLSEVYGVKWMIGAAARILNQGCQMDTVLVLQEPTGGEGKTSFVRALGTLDWTSDSALDMSSKDGAMKLQGIWLYELSELASLRRSEVESVKQFLTIRVDKYRPPYGRCVVERKRSVAFIGTTNEDTFLQGVDRRFWVRRVVRPLDVPAVIRDRDQLWAEAVHRFKAGERWWLTREERALGDEDTECYRSADPWEESIARFLRDRPDDTTVTTKDILDNCLKLEEAKKGRADEIRVGKILATMGYRRKRARVDGLLRWVYQKK
jgi:hypothetical protein